ncbi:MAG: helix-turn-helix domain-containing protein [Caulobacter sp.]|nr:helix-turn-helix domain-containing protein [Caulobacter sp.]
MGATVMRSSCHACPLRRLPAFKTGRPDEIDFIQTMKVGEETYAAGETIIAEGAEGSPLYSLLSGWAFRYSTLADGRRQILNFLLPGELIGVQANFLGAATHGVEALGPAVLCRLARNKMWDLYRNHPTLGFDVTWLTAHEEGLVDETLLSVGRRTALERVATLLLYLYKRAVSIDMARDGVLDLPVTQSHLADALGLSRAHVNETLGKLEKRGLFRFRRGRLEMLNPRALETIADYYDQPLDPRPLL